MIIISLHIAKEAPKTLGLLTCHVGEPNLHEYVQWFLYD